MGRACTQLGAIDGDPELGAMGRTEGDETAAASALGLDDGASAEEVDLLSCRLGFEGAPALRRALLRRMALDAGVGSGSRRSPARP